MSAIIYVMKKPDVKIRKTGVSGEKRKYQKKRRAELEEQTRLLITESAVELHGTLGPSRTSIRWTPRRPIPSVSVRDPRSEVGERIMSSVSVAIEPWKKALPNPGNSLALCSTQSRAISFAVATSMVDPIRCEGL